MNANATTETVNKETSPTTQRFVPMAEQQVADLLGMSVKTLRAWRLQNRGPRFVRFGRSVRYYLHDIEAYIQRCEVATMACLRSAAVGYER